MSEQLRAALEASVTYAAGVGILDWALFGQLGALSNMAERVKNYEDDYFQKHSYIESTRNYGDSGITVTVHLIQ